MQKIPQPPVSNQPTFYEAKREALYQIIQLFGWLKVTRKSERILCRVLCLQDFHSGKLDTETLSKLLNQLIAAGRVRLMVKGRSIYVILRTSERRAA